jgi:rhodanese-related sulfurtransferase
MKIRSVLIQAVAVCGISAAIAFTYNAFSDNGINPFRKINNGEIDETSDNGVDGSIDLIGLKQFRTMSKEKSIFLDARTESDYREGHIPGAILFDYYQFGRFADKVLPFLDPESEIIVYCSSPVCDSSSFLARELFALGYHNVYVYKEGFSNWEREGLPVEKGLE